jgi:hypothetical protein
MTETKYGRYVKSLSFHDYGPGFYRQGTKMDGEFLGLGAHIQYGTYWAAGKMGGDNGGTHVHDFDQVMFWFGGDTSDMGELGAEIELFLGEEKEKHMITTTTAVYIPKGFQHLPANVTRMDKRYIYMEVSCAPEYLETSVPSNDKNLDAIPVSGFGSRYRERVVHPPFIRKGAWSYGPKNRDDSGGALAVIRGKEFNSMILCESIKKAPYRFGPVPDKPHVHPLSEILIFIGTDTNDLSVLGAEVEISLGEEQERHIITTPTAVVCPGNLPHCPLTITKIDRPIILTDVRPFGITEISSK